MKKGNFLPTHIYTLRKELKKTQQEIAAALGCDLKTYRKYEKGYKMPGSDLLMDMYAYYKKNGVPVTTDYILGLSNWRTPETDFIGNHTGLSDNAINNLHCDKLDTQKYGRSINHEIDMLNFLLCDKDGSDLLCSVYHYLFGNYIKTDSNSETLKLLDASEIPCNGGEIPIKDINALFLSNIVENLSQIKGKLSNIPGSDRYGKFNPDTATDEAKLWANIPSFIR